MKATIMGKQTATSKKTGSMFQILFYAYDQNGVEGQAVDKTFIFDDKILSGPVHQGDAVELSFNQRGFLTSVEVL